MDRALADAQKGQRWILAFFKPKSIYSHSFILEAPSAVRISFPLIFMGEDRNKPVYYSKERDMCRSVRRDSCF